VAEEEAAAEADDDVDAEAEAEAEAEADDVVDVVELDELDEQPATARTESATAPDRPASRRNRVRGCVRFMIPSLRSLGSAKVSIS
jgi:hypothetical protein